MKLKVNNNEFQLQKCLNWVILSLNLFEFIMKKEFQTWNSALAKFTQDALIGFVPLFPLYNWNHYRQIRVNVISLRL